MTGDGTRANPWTGWERWLATAREPGEIVFRSGYYRTCNLSLSDRDGMHLQGEPGAHIVPTPGCTGPLVTLGGSRDTGAYDVVIDRLTFDCSGAPGVTAGLYIGYYALHGTLNNNLFVGCNATGAAGLLIGQAQAGTYDWGLVGNRAVGNYDGIVMIRANAIDALRNEATSNTHYGVAVYGVNLLNWVGGDLEVNREEDFHIAGGRNIKIINAYTEATGSGGNIVVHATKYNSNEVQTISIDGLYTTCRPCSAHSIVLDPNSVENLNLTNSRFNGFQGTAIQNGGGNWGTAIGNQIVGAKTRLFDHDAGFFGADGAGLLVKSPDGKVCKTIGIDDSGKVVTDTVTCP